MCLHLELVLQTCLALRQGQLQAPGRWRVRAWRRRPRAAARAGARPPPPQPAGPPSTCRHPRRYRSRHTDIVAEPRSLWTSQVTAQRGQGRVGEKDPRPDTDTRAAQAGQRGPARALTGSATGRPAWPRARPHRPGRRRWRRPPSRRPQPPARARASQLRLGRVARFRHLRHGLVCMFTWRLDHARPRPPANIHACLLAASASEVPCKTARTGCWERGEQWCCPPRCTGCTWLGRASASRKRGRRNLRLSAAAPPAIGTLSQSWSCTSGHPATPSERHAKPGQPVQRAVLPCLAAHDQDCSTAASWHGLWSHAGAGHSAPSADVAHLLKCMRPMTSGARRAAQLTPLMDITHNSHLTRDPQSLVRRTAVDAGVVGSLYTLGCEAHRG